MGKKNKYKKVKKAAKKALENDKHIKSNKPCPYKLINGFQEAHQGQIWGAQFNHWLYNPEPMLATVAGNRVTIYKCHKDEEQLEILQYYTDPDVNECLYTVAWSFREERHNCILAAGGKNAMIRIFDWRDEKRDKTLVGFGGPIYDIKFHPTRPNILAACSKDFTVRLWNIQTSVCIAIFGGCGGHRDEVCAIDFDGVGNRILSSGLDHSLMVWHLDKPEIKDAILNSETYKDGVARCGGFKTVFEHFPDFCTRSINTNYVDCVKWIGDMILSKAKGDGIVLWEIARVDEKPMSPPVEDCAAEAGDVEIIESDVDTNWVTISSDTDDDVQFVPSAHAAAGSTLTRKALSAIKPYGSGETGIKSFAKKMGCFHYPDGDLWFTRFTYDDYEDRLVVGTDSGKVFLWDTKVKDPLHAPYWCLNHSKRKTAVRQIAFSKNSEIMIIVCDDGTVWRYDKK